MLTPNIASLLTEAQTDGQLNGRIARATSWEELAEIGADCGCTATPAEFRGAFVARSARVVAPQMMRQALVARTELPHVPPLDPELWRRIESLDLSMVKRQVERRTGWSADRLDAAERGYRRFLYMCVAGLTAVPTDDIDELWHNHILNTDKYSADCLHLAGKFIHHEPASEDTDEQAIVKDAFFDTWFVYETLFEEPYDSTAGAALLARWPNPQAYVSTAV